MGDQLWDLLHISDSGEELHDTFIVRQFSTKVVSLNSSDFPVRKLLFMAKSIEKKRKKENRLL